ncbi:MAG: hypothetical protein MJ059_04995 [Lachnospiraceae bacterium]|nr:hypothetical protein [Lachnospiraceae bacterium]
MTEYVQDYDRIMISKEMRYYKNTQIRPFSDLKNKLSEIEKTVSGGEHVLTKNGHGRGCVFLSLVFLLSGLMAFNAKAAAYSEYWKQDNDGSWYVEEPGGMRVRNAWLCDDAVYENGKDVWYLIDNDGSMVVSPLVRDGTGNYYSLETEHNGHYGMLRYKTGTYEGVELRLQGEHDGNFAALLNEDGKAALEAVYGVTDVAHIDNSRCVYTGDFLRTADDTYSGRESGNIKASSEEKAGGDSQKGAKAMASDVDEELCAGYFMEYLNDYRREIGRGDLEISYDQMEYAKERAERESVSHEGNLAAYEICCTHGVLPSEYEDISVEEAVAQNALKAFKASASHNSILKLKTISTMGAGFHVIGDKGNGTFNFYYCEANFEK